MDTTREDVVRTSEPEYVDDKRAFRWAATAREDEIRLHAYYRAERRGFLPGHDLEDWLAAERQILGIDAAHAAVLFSDPSKRGTTEDPPSGHGKTRSPELPQV